MSSPDASKDTPNELCAIAKLCTTVQNLEQAIEDAVEHILATHRRPPQTVDLRVQAWRCSAIRLLNRAKTDNRTLAGMPEIEENMRVTMEKFDFYTLVASVGEKEHIIADFERAISKPGLIGRGFFGLLWFISGYNRKNVFKNSIKSQIPSIVSELRSLLACPYFGNLSLEEQKSFVLKFKKYYRIYHSDIEVRLHAALE